MYRDRSGRYWASLENSCTQEGNLANLDARCEYTGVTTLTKAINRWGEETIGGQMGDGHDHFKVPHLAHESLTSAEQSQILALSPRVKEIFQRYNI